MVCQQAKSVYTESEALYPLLDEKIEPVSVFIAEEDILTGVPSEDDVITCSRIMKTGFSCHGYILSSSCNLAILFKCISKC